MATRFRRGPDASLAETQLVITFLPASENLVRQGRAALFGFLSSCPPASAGATC